jgi:hypothetical protein
VARGAHWSIISAARQIIDDNSKLLPPILNRVLWVPGHSNHPGNDEADRLAELARALSDNNVIAIHLPTPKKQTQKHITLALNHHLQQLIDKDTSKQVTHLKQYFRNVNTTNDFSPYPTEGANRKLEVAINRMILGYAMTADTLHKMKYRPNSKCDYCGHPDSINHQFYACPQHYSQRSKAKKQLQLISTSSAAKTPLTFTLHTFLNWKSAPPPLQQNLKRILHDLISQSEMINIFVRSHDLDENNDDDY